VNAPWFVPYRGTDVKLGTGGYIYIQLALLGLGPVYATIHPVPVGWREHINNDPMVVSLLGQGEAPTVWWHELSTEQRRALAETLTPEERVGYLARRSPTGEPHATPVTFDVGVLAWTCLLDDGRSVAVADPAAEVYPSEAEAIEAAATIYRRSS
jgi:hypothetical protein